MQLKPNTLLQGGKYRIERMLGQGGFGITYLGTQVALNRKVAIKEFFMKEYCNRDSDTSQVSVGSEGSKELVGKFRQKFIKEAQNIAALNHPHIIRIYDVFEENGTAYYVMEYWDNGSLADLVKKRGKLSEEEALHYIRQVADALGYIHDRKMNHLDVKPGNILLDEEGNAVLIDFGLSKRYDEEGNQTSTTPVGISHGYAPLEQYKKGGVGTFSPATDIYSLGATLYKLLTGQTPPEANDVMDDGLPALPPSVSAATATAIEKAMQPVRRDRPQSIDAFLGVLHVPSSVTSSVQSELRKESVQTFDEETEIRTPIHVEIEEKKKKVTETSRSNATFVTNKNEKKHIGMIVCIALCVIGSLLLFIGNGNCKGREDDKDSVRVIPQVLTPSFEENIDLDCTNVEERNLLQIRISAMDELYINGDNAEVSEIKSRAKEFIENPDLLPNLPDKRPHEIAIFGTVNITDRHVILLLNDSQPNSSKYIDVRNELIAAYNELRDELAHRVFHESFAELSEEEKYSICQYYPMRISETRPTVPAPSLLYVTTSPSGATVYVDGKKVGTTPIEGKEVAQGHHTVKITKSGYESFSEKKQFGDKPVVINQTLVAEIKEEAKEVAPVQTVVQSQVTISSSTGIINGPNYVDLGLSVKWADRNVGASSPSDYGNYYAWGETSPESEYWGANSVTYEKDFGDIAGKSQYDAAQANWGGSWRLPTKAECQELVDKCQWTWTTQGGHNGYKVTGPNSNSIFLPAAGWRFGASLDYVGGGGFYWSSTPYGGDTQRAYYLSFNSSYRRVYWNHRYCGLIVRPVSD